MPGPMVEQSVTLRTYLPFAAAGLARTTAVISVCAFSSSLSPGEAHLADRSVDNAGFVDAELDFTRLGFLHRFGDIGVTVPVFGLGIRPRGPRILPRRPTERIMSGVAITASKSIQPSSECG